MADYAYLKRWLSQAEIRKIREGDNPDCKILTRQQIWRIMKLQSNNFPIRNYLVERARRNEAITLNKA